MADWWDANMKYEARRRHERMDVLSDADVAKGMVLVWQRKICWPDPDATCLMGGCIHCDIGPWKNLSTIENYAGRAGMLPHRGRGEAPARQAFETGVSTGFYGRPRIRRVKVKRRANARAER